MSKNESDKSKRQDNRIWKMAGNKNKKVIVT